MPSEDALEPDEQYTVFHPSEVELSETTRRILDEVERVKPTRIVFDSLSELRLLAGSALRYRRQILALKQFFAGRRCTVLLLDDLTSAEHDLQVQSIAHGALLLEHTVPLFGEARRRLSVTKFRGSDFRGGYHDYAIRRGGLQVFPRLVAAEFRQPSSRERIASGLAALDTMLGGGLERGTSTLIQGAAGTGKSTLAALFATHCAAQGGGVALFIFDESVNTLYRPLRRPQHPPEGACRGWPDRRAAGRPGRTVAWRIRGHYPRGRRATARAARRDRQPERVPQLDARRDVSRRSAARASHLSRTVGRGHDSHRRAPRHDERPDELADRRELSCGLGRAAPLLRDGRRSEAGDLRGEDARRRARAQSPRVQHEARQDRDRRASARLPRRADRRAGAGARGE